MTLWKWSSKVLKMLNLKTKSKVRCKKFRDHHWFIFQIHGPNIQPCHCVLGLVEKDGVVTVTPNSPESETHVNNQRISETTTLQNGMTVRFGKLHVFRFIDPNFEEVSENSVSIFIDCLICRPFCRRWICKYVYKLYLDKGLYLLKDHNWSLSLQITQWWILNLLIFYWVVFLGLTFPRFYCRS